MRRALRQALPAFRRTYGLTWAEIADMPRGEFEAYLDDLHALSKPR